MKTGRTGWWWRRGGAAALVFAGLAGAAGAGNPDGDLRVEIITAYNLVVDSNAESPSTYAPKSAYIGAQFWNDGTAPLTNVWAYIGDYAAGTPGIYPSRAHPGLTGPLPGGEFALTHEGGAMGTTDATRYVGTIPPGECVTVYWLASYPQLDETGNAVWGDSVKPEDDLWVEYDVWATARDGAAYLEADDTRTMTMRNEISAMANKIWPNGANKVPQEYQDLLQQYVPTWTNTSATATPGAILRTEGIWYDLGNVGDGFDNDGDLVPDRNAWLQPVGDPDLFDPSCFRLIRTYVMVIVKLNDGTEQVIIAEDQLYFTQIPANNRGAVGYVMYEFIAVGSGCQSTLTPYQEVASGFDNEKFNGDYGAPGQTLTGGTSLLAIAKSADPLVTRPGSNIAYTVTYTNAGPDPSGRPDLGLPVVIQDSIPTGTLYVAGSAAAANVLPAGVSAYTVYYSTNHGATWSLTEPAAATNVTDVQWWLSDPLPPGGAGTVRFSVTVKNPWPFPEPVVPNTAGLSFGNTMPFLWAHAQTLLLGNNALGDLVWRDDGAGGGYLGNQRQEGGEAGITGVTVRVYYDADADGAVGAGDFLVAATNTVASGLYGVTNLPDGRFVVVVDAADADIPFGYTPTTPTTWSIALDPARTNVNGVVNLTADFGFAPALTLVKTRTSTNAIREGQLISYNLTVSNNLPGNGTGGGMLATYTAWARGGTATDAEWHSYTNVFVPVGPDGIYTTNHFDNAEKLLTLSNFTVGVQNGSVSNVAVVMPIVMTPPLGSDDELSLTVSRRSPAATIYSRVYRATNLVSGMWTVPMTGTFAWAWADFATNYTITMGGAKNSGGAAGGDITIDAVGFQVAGDWTTGLASATTTLNPVPLTDVYDPAKLQYVASQPPLTSSTTGSVGTLYWSNVGPIYPGGTSTVAVTFKLLEPPNNTNTLTTNTVWTTNSYFQGGARANDATSSVVVTQFPAATVGDYVWRDLNGDGVQNETNTGIANVAVSITPPEGIDLGNGLGAAITNWTDAAGYYLFESIPATGVYTVRVVTATLPGGSGVNTYDERGAYDSTAAIYLDIYSATNSTNNVHRTTDFGYQVQSVIEGTIWHDADRGQETYREAGEDWMTNVTVYLCASPSPCGPGASIATNVTTTNGYFRFVGNYSGTYTVYVATNSGMLGTGSWKVSWDSNGTNTPHYDNEVTVPLGGVGRADFSYLRTGPYRIGDTVFWDWNSNGVQNVESEGGISNVTVHLYEDANGDGVVDANVDAYVASTVTATNGYYVFTNLYATNTYLVIVDRGDPDLPASAIVTADPWGAMDARSVVTIVNADNFDQDFGFWPYGTGAIGDTVWKDVNADGIQSGYQETGIPSVLVTLYHEANGTWWPLRSTNTDANGEYLFPALPDGNYRVVVDDADADLPQDGFGNAYHPTTPVFHDAAISGGNTYLDADFGFAPYGAIGDTVFWDIGRNGDQDYNDPGVPGVEVRLYADANGNGIYDTGETLVATETTGADGRYLFDQLLPGSYVVVVETASGPLAGADQTADPQSDGLTCSNPELTVPCDDQCGWALAPAQIFLGADFGYAPRGVIGDTLWIDANDNGARDAGELGIPYVDVVLYSNGVAIATNATDADGYYGFSGLVDFANYGVRAATNDVDFPAGLVNTYAADLTMDNYATNIVMSGGVVTSIGGYPCTGCDLNVDFGYRYAGNNSLSGTIGLDATPYDGLMNGLNPSGPGAGESPYAGVPVTLHLWNDDGDGVIEAGETVQIGTTATDANGDYSFTGLPNGDGNDQYVVASPAPESFLTLTTTNGSIAGVTVFSTTNLQGYAVSARLAVNVAPAITNMDFAYKSSQSYDYGDLPDSYDTLAAAGARHVLPTVPNLYLGAGVDAEPNGVPSAAADGDDLAGSDDESGVVQIVDSVWRTGAAGGSVQVTVGAGNGWLLGYIDFNGDGDFVDAGEMVANLAVSNTGGNGAGVYTNAFTVPAGTFSTTSSTPLYARFRLYPEEPVFPELAYAGTAGNGEVEDYLWHLAGVGDYVWYDHDGDGVQDAGEPPIAGVRVFADLNDDGVWQSTEPAATTDSSGLYGIGGLVPGTYSIVVDTNTLLTGVTPTYDLDGIGTPHQAEVTITALDQFISTVDFGYAPPVDIGDRVWFDANRDGIQDAGETNGVPNVPVTLLNGAGTIVAETVADADGYYLFANMPTGTYLVRFDLSALTTNEMLSPSKVGNDDKIDSDSLSGNTTDFAWTAPFSTLPGQTNLDVDLGITTRSSTRAGLAAVWGEWTEGEGRVAFRTSSEFNTAGFFVHRVDPETGAETRLNARLLPAAFQEAGATYRLPDPEIPAEDAEAVYRLEEVELSGEFRDLGTHAVRFAPAPAPARAARAAPVAPRRATPAGGTSSVLKVQVEREGVHGVELPALAAGMGISLEAARGLAETGSLRITRQGTPVPTVFDAGRDRLLFHAPAPARNWYSHSDAYLVSAGAGRAMARRAPGASTGASAFPVTLHFEENRFLFNMTRMPDDFYFWEGVVSGTNDLLAPRLPLDLSGHAGGEVRLKVRLMGWSNTTNDPDHHAEFQFNGMPAGDIAFDGQDVAEAELTIPAAAVSNGLNTLTVNGRMAPDQSHSFFVVDWVEASFRRELAPWPVPAHFPADGAAAVSAQAFAEPVALALDAAGNPTWLADENGGLPDKAWAAGAADERFEVVEAAAVPLLAPEPAAADAWFMSAENQIDYLVIAPRALAAPAQELADYRAGQGLRTGLAVFEDVCDLLAGGGRTPEAIPALLKHAAATWAVAPRMVVLAGNGHYDYLGATFEEVNHLPPLLVQTPSGVCASDGLLADTGGDELPDLALGRLPALTAADLSAMVAKIQAYEAAAGAEWRNRLVLAADNADAAGDFPGANARLAALVEAPWTVADRIELGGVDVGAARTNLMAWFGTGAGFINYVGHGGIKGLAAENLLTDADVSALESTGRPGVAVALTCLAARYEVPAVHSLGEQLLRKAQGGAVAMLGPSGLSQNAPATDMGEAFYRAVFEEDVGELGPAFLRARRSLPASLFTKDTIAVYNLLGDPALRLAAGDPGEPARLPAQVALSGLAQTYAGAPRVVSATTDPPGLAVRITYDGHPAAPVDAGTYVVAATVATAGYEGSAGGTLVVAKAPAAVALDGLAQTYDGTARTATAATAPAGLPVEWTYDGSAEAPVAAGSYVVVAAVADANHEGAATGTLVVAKASAAVALDGLAQTYDGTPRFATATTVPGDLAVDFTYDGAVRAPRAAGTYAVVARVADPNWQGVATGALTVGKGDQTIWFPPIGAAAPTDVLDLSATASSGLPVSYEVLRGPAALAAGGGLAFTGEGEVAVAARQAGDANWNAAPDVVQVFAVVVPPPRLEIAAGGPVRVREGGEGRFFVRLAAAPKTNVVVNVARGAGGGELAVRSGAVLGFTPANWSVWQAVTLVAAEDANGLAESATFEVAAAGGEAWFVDAATLDDDIGENLARAEGGTTAKGTGASQPKQLIDGVHNAATNYGWTVWTNVPPGAITLDLKGTATVSRVRLLNWDWVRRAHRYVIETSVDGTNWSMLADASGEDHHGWDEWTVPDRPARFVKFTGLSNSANQSIVVSELEVYGARPALPTDLPQPVLSKTSVLVREGGTGRFFVRLAAAPPDKIAFSVESASGAAGIAVQGGATLAFTPLNWSEWQAVTLAAAEDDNATGETAAFRIAAPGHAERIVTATTLDDDIGRNLALAAGGATIRGARASQAAQVIDGVHNSAANYGWTIWTNLAAPGTFTLDLKATATVSRVRVLNWDWTHQAHRYAIETSPDGAIWTSLADAGGGEHHGWEEWTAPERQVRYVKFTGLSNSANQGVMVSELEVYGAQAVLSQTAVNVREGGTGRFFVRLDGPPADVVTCRVGFAEGAAGLAVHSGAALRFTPLNWNEWQAVTLAAAEDGDAEGETATFRITAAGQADRTVAATALDDEIGENLALAAGGATIRGTRASQAAQLIDGIHDVSANYGWTVWTNDPPGTITLDLNTEATVARVRLLNWNWVHRAQRYRIESSPDGTNWTLLADASAVDRQGWDDWPGGGQPIRLLRFTGLSSSANQAVVVSELEVYGTRRAARRSAGTVKGALVEPAMLDAGAREPFPLTIVTSDGEGPDYTNGWAAVDGDPSTCWTGRAGAGGWYIAIGYDGTVRMTNLVVDLAAGSADRFECRTSLDGVDWRVLPGNAEDGPVELNYLWLLFPGGAATSPAPAVIEILPLQ